jgi:LytR cell envelope-related transcriptional attenuator
MAVPFAFSVHHFINSVGSDAGFAAIIGLAVLILLYFAHARETANLREQVYEWAQRVQQLEARITQLSRQQASVAPEPAPPVATPPRAAPAPAAAAAARAGSASTTVAPTAAPVRVPAMAGAPAGVAAPALTAATKLIPAGEALAPAPDEEAPPSDITTIAPAPVTVAGGANGASHDHVETPPPVAARTAAATAAPPPPRIQIRPGTTAPGRRPPAPPRGQPQRGGGGPSRARRGLVALLVAVIVAAVVGGLLVLTSGGSSNKTNTASASSNRHTTTTTHRRATKPGPVTPSSVTVAVLNGTATSGLAGRVSQKLIGDGYKKGQVATAADQTHTTTIVAYLPGHRNDALAVAHSLGLGPPTVQAVDQAAQGVACSAPSACTADVVVTLGTNLANTQ